MEKNKKIRAIALFSVAVFIAACASATPPVVNKLDENTGVTVTYSRTPFVFSPNETVDDYSAAEYVQVGMIEINTMGSLRYYLWMGVSEPKFAEKEGSVSERFGFVDFDIDGREFRLDAIGSSHEAIGTSEPVYACLYKSTEDVYFDIELDQIGMFVAANDISFRNADSLSNVYRPWYKAVAPYEDLAEFHRTVIQ
jgi:hypothetical protein